MRKQSLSKQDSAVLNSAGGATLEFGPTLHGVEWLIQTIGVTSDSLDPEPTVKVYKNGVFVGGSFAATLDADTTFNQTLLNQQRLRVVWEGGDPGKTVTVSLTGVETIQGG